MLKKTGKLLIVGLIGAAVLLAGQALAAAPQTPAMPFYYVTGEVIGTNHVGRQVLFYKTEADLAARKYISTDSIANGANGAYALNIFELEMIYGITIEAGSSYKMSVLPVSGGTNNGVTNNVMISPAKGYMSNDLTLVNGGGPEVGTIRVLVQDEVATPLTIATVSITSAQVADNTAGVYTIENVIPGNYQVHAAATGYIPNSASVIVKENEITDVTITLNVLPPYHGVFWGYVRDNETKIGLGTATVEALSSHNRYLTASEIDGWYQQVATMDAYTLTTVLYGYQVAQKTGIALAEDQANHQDFDLLADPTVGRGTITGEVKRAADGILISGANVSLGNLMEVRTLSDGTYSMPSVPVNTYDMVAYANTFIPQFVSDIPVTAGNTTTVNFNLAALLAGRAAVFGKVQSSAGSNLVGAQVNMAGPDTYLAQSTSKGTYEVINIALGNYAMDASFGGYDPQSKSESFGDGDVKRVDFTLSPPEGTVPLTITRQGYHVLVEWDAAYGIPQLFILTGNGDGVYTNVIGSWTGPLPISGSIGGVYDIEIGKMTHYGQIGGGTSEAYYKALQTGVSSTLLANAKAVGKVNVGVGLEWNLISIPYMSNPGGLDTALGVNEFTANEQILEWDRVNQKFMPGKTANFGAGTWGNVITASNGIGYGLNITTVPNGETTKTITVIGDIARADYSSRLETNWNQIGYPFPVSKSLNEGAFQTPNNNDQVLEWSYQNKQFLVPASTYLDGSWYFNKQNNILSNVKLKPGIGYGYNRVGSYYNWNVPKP